MKFRYKGKYPKSVVLYVTELLNRDMDIRSIVELTGVPETTIRNWKFGYTKLYGAKIKLNKEMKQKISNLVNNGYSMPLIAQELGLGYDIVRLFLKNNLSLEEYGLIKVSNKELPKNSKILTPELSYILGVLYGDGFFGVGQIRLDAKDKDFVDFFSSVIKKWCGKKPSKNIGSQNNNPYFRSYLTFKGATNFIKDIIGDRSKVPELVTSSKNKEVMKMFILGFCDSEGSVTINLKARSNSIRMYNQNKLVLEQIKEMMTQLGFDYNKLAIVVNNKAKNGDVYALRMCYLDQMKLFYHQIGFTIQRKQEKLKDYLKNKQIL